MKKTKILIILLVLALFSIIFTLNYSNASSITATRNIYSNDGSMRFEIKGLKLDETHEYQFGLTTTKAENIEKWHLVAEHTTTSAIIDISSNTSDLRKVVDKADVGYVTIKDKTVDKVILEPYALDFKIPFLQVANYAVINNGKQFGSNTTDEINIPLRNAANSKAFYQYEKITDEKLISKYKEIKSKNGNMLELQSLIKSEAPKANWSSWGYWNGYLEYNAGFGYTQRTVSTPDSGLYYMWLYFSGNDMKPLYGCILVDNLENEIALDSITLPKTQEIELGKTLTLKPTFSPENTTNKIVKWTSSDETVATVDNAGKITPKKIGSTIITVTSQDGKKKASCTVTVVDKTSDKNTTTTNNTVVNTIKNNTTSTTNTVGTNNTVKDTTIKGGVLPNTGIGFGLIITIVSLVGGGIFTYFKYNNLKDIK